MKAHWKIYRRNTKKGKLVFIKNTIKPKIIIETMLNIEKLLTMKKIIIAQYNRVIQRRLDEAINDTR